MKHILNYNNFLCESSDENKFYLLYGELVYVDSIRYFGDQIQIFYTRQDGSDDTYVADNYKEFAEDFIETDNNFGVESKFIKKEIPVSSDNKLPKEDYMCNLVYYVGNIRKENIRINIPSKLAYALKAKYSKLPQYKSGNIKVEKFK